MSFDRLGEEFGRSLSCHQRVFVPWVSPEPFTLLKAATSFSLKRKVIGAKLTNCSLGHVCSVVPRSGDWRRVRRLPDAEALGSDCW